jgi:hypothetical protein
MASVDAPRERNLSNLSFGGTELSIKILVDGAAIANQAYLTTLSNPRARQLLDSSNPSIPD